MPQLLPVTIDGETIYIEAEPAYGSEETGAAVDEALDRAAEAFVGAQTTVTSVAKGMVGAIQRLDQASTPHAFTLEFSIKFTAEGTAIVARAGAEANLKITMPYTRDKAPAKEDP